MLALKFKLQLETKSIFALPGWVQIDLKTLIILLNFEDKKFVILIWFENFHNSRPIIREYSVKMTTQNIENLGGSEITMGKGVNIFFSYIILYFRERVHKMYIYVLISLGLSIE